MRRHKRIVSIELWSTVILWVFGIGFASGVHFVVGPFGVVVFCGGTGMILWAIYDQSLAFRNLPRRLFHRPLEPPPPRFTVPHWERLQDRFVDLADELAISVAITRATGKPSHTSFVKGENRSLLYRAWEQRGGQMLLESGLEMPVALTSEADHIQRWRYALWYFKIPSTPGPDYSVQEFFQYEPAQFAGAALCSEIISRIEQQE